MIALDDGSTDGTGELLRSHPLVDQVLSNPTRGSYADWDDRANRQRLLDAAKGSHADWLLFLDADETIDEEDAAALEDFVNRDALRNCAYGFQVFRMVGNADTYDPRGLWVYRMFANRDDLADLPERRLHFVPVPSDIPRQRWVRTTIRIQHFGSLSEERRRSRYMKYEVADPHNEYQDDYTGLLEPAPLTKPWPARPEGIPALMRSTGLFTRPNRQLSEDQRIAMTVVVIAQDDEEVIERALSALAAQDFAEEFETIVVGSGSDSTVMKAREHSPHIRSIQLPRRVFPGEARNVGLWMARGEFITFPGSHVWLTEKSLQHRLDAHDRGWDLVTGAVHNGNTTKAGWASYFLDHSSQLPSRPSSELRGPPGHSSYHWRDLWDLGGFPMDKRAGEDTVVNMALHASGRRTFFESEASFFHASPANSVKELIKHHRKRGRAMGQIVKARRSVDRLSMMDALKASLGMTRRRLKTIDQSMNRWGGDEYATYLEVRSLVRRGAKSAGRASFKEMVSVTGDARPRQSIPPSRGSDGGIALMGRPGVPEFGLLGAGSPREAARRVDQFFTYTEGAANRALCLTVAAEVATAGWDGRFINDLEENIVAEYEKAAAETGAFLILQIQEPLVDLVAAVHRWMPWLARNNVGVFFDIPVNELDDEAQVTEAVELVHATIPPDSTKPILVSTPISAESPAVVPEIEQISQLTSLPLKVKEGSWLFLA